MFTYAVVDHSNEVNKELFANEAKNGTIQISNSMTPIQPATGLPANSKHCIREKIL